MIIITRDSGYADRLRNYKVEVDGTVIGAIGDGEKKSFNVAPGKHVLRLKIDWASINKLEFESTPDKTFQFKCASRAKGVKVFLVIVYGTILSQRYIKLEQITG